MILDGWGYREDPDANAIDAAHKPNWDQLWAHSPHTLLSGSGSCVGLPDGQMGNSEVGHLNMGAGRLVYQDLTRINLAINSGEFYENHTLIDAIQQARDTHRAVHVLGLLSPGGVHSHEKHIHALIELAAKQNLSHLYIHAFLDGRDTPPKSALPSLTQLEACCHQFQCGKLVSLIGRYYAMDRDQRFDRVQQAYDLLSLGKANYHARTPQEGLEQAYARGETDEFVRATSIHSNQSTPVTISDGDIVIFMNFRADRARELTQAFIDPHFSGFTRERQPKLGEFVCLSEYDPRFSLPVAFPTQNLRYTLGETLSLLGLSQLRIAETEKYAHVTFFFNGGIETPYPGEERILIPSPKIATYDLSPEMSAIPLTERLVHEIQLQQYDLIVCNFANPDMVGHTGNFNATVKAIETIDLCLGKILTTLEKYGGELLITADHGNAEDMFNRENNQPHTAHTCHPVPFIYVGRNAAILKENGNLSDIAPTILMLMGLSQPSEMTGTPLMKLV
jgi:2,3-bisphosphoglycerate-independent phosphoglycerate mutase